MQILCIVENKVNHIVSSMARENFMNAAKKSKTNEDDSGSNNEDEEEKEKEEIDYESHSVNSDKVDETIMNGVKEAGQLTAKSESIHNAWIFFLLSIGKNKKIDVPKEMGLRVVADQIKFHKKLFRNVPKQEL